MNRFIKIVYLISKSNRNFLDLFKPKYIESFSISFMLDWEKYCICSEFPQHNYLQYVGKYNESLIRYCFHEIENKDAARQFNSYGTIGTKISKKDFLSHCDKLVSYIRKYNKFLDINNKIEL